MRLSWENNLELNLRVILIDVFVIYRAWKKIIFCYSKAKLIECYVFHFWFRYYHKYYKN